MARRRLFQLVQALLTIALFVFIFFKAQGFLEQVDWASIPGIWLHVVLAACFFTLGFVALSQHWLLVAREIVPDITARQRLAFFASQPYKYLPTSFFTLSFRTYYAKKLGMSVRDSSKAQLIENINIVGAAFAIASLTWLMAFNMIYGLLAAVGLSTIFIVLWFNHHIDIRLYKTKSVLHMRCWIRAFLWAMLAWTLIAIGFYALAVGLQKDASLLQAISATGYAFGAGILAIFAPGGIGVREVIFSSFGFVASTVVLWRCITFVIDLLLGIISIVLIRRSRR